MRYWLTALLAAAFASPAQAETLAEALASAYQTNPTLDGARQAARQADEGIAQARAGFLPQIGVSGSIGTELRISESDTAFGTVRTQPAQKTYEPQDATLTVSQSVFEGGRRLAQMGLANARIAGARESLRSTEQNIMGGVIQAYVDVRRDEAALRIRQDNVELLRQQLDASRERFAVGEVTRTDVAQAEARLAGAEAGVAAAKSDLESSRANYAAIVGRAPTDLEPTPPLANLPATLDDAISFALDYNPDLRRFKANERAAVQQVRIERADLLPQVSLVGRMQHQNEPFGIDNRVDSQSATAQVSMPLFEGGLARSRTRAARIAVRQAEAQTEEVRRSVVSDVTAAWNDYFAALRIIDASNQQVAANQLALDGVIQEQMVGLRSTLDILNAQQELLDSQLSLIRAERDAYVASAFLLQTIGRLDAEAIGVNAPLYDPEDHRRAVLWTILSTKPARDR